MRTDRLTPEDRARLNRARLRSQVLKQCIPDTLDRQDNHDGVRVFILRDWLAAAEEDRAALVVIIDRLMSGPQPTDSTPAGPIRRGFMCSTSLEWDLDPTNPKSVEVWASEGAIREACKCINPRETGACGIDEVEIRSVRIVQTPTPSEITKEPPETL